MSDLCGRRPRDTVLGIRLLSVRTLVYQGYFISVLYVLNDVLRRFRCRCCFSVVSFFLSFHETLACAKVTVKMTFYSVMHLTNKLNKSSVQLGAWVCSAGGLFPSPSWQAVLTCYKAPSYSINHLVSGSSDFAVLHPTPPLCPT